MRSATAVDAGAGSVALRGGKTVPVRRYKNVPLDCATCHKDPHLGQVGKDCASCHTVEGVKFGPDRSTSKGQIPPDRKARRARLREMPPEGDRRLPGRQRHGRPADRAPDRLRRLPQGRPSRSARNEVRDVPLHGDLRGEELSAPEQGRGRLLRRKARHGRVPRLPPEDGGQLPGRPRNGGPVRRPSDVGLPALPQGRAPGRARERLRFLSRDVEVADGLARLPQGHESSSRGRHSRSPAPPATGRASSKGRPTAVSTATGSGGRTTSTGRASGTTARTATDDLVDVRPPGTTRHRPASRSTARTPASAATSATRTRSSRARRPTATRATQRTTRPRRTRTTSPAASRPPATPATGERPDLAFGDVRPHEFPLAGAHATPACAACHKNNDYRTIPTSPCSACHSTDYQNATTPGATSPPVPDGVRTCHAFADMTWQQGTPFKHSTLRPRRRPCHHGLRQLPQEQRLHGRPTSHCTACHQADFQNATTPVNHAGFPTACETCHAFSDPTWQQKTPSTIRLLRPGGDPRHHGVCQLSQEQQLRDRRNEPLFGLPHDRLQQLQEPAPRRLRLPDDLRHVPQVLGPDLAARDVPRPHTVFPLVGRPPHDGLRQLSQERNYTTVPTSPCVGLPPTDFHNATSPVNHAGFPTTCDTCHRYTDPTWPPGLRPRHVLPPRRRPRHDRVRPVPQERQLHDLPTNPCSACHQTDFHNARRRSTTPASRRRARPATSSPTRPGPRGSTQPLPSSPSSGPTSRPRAPTATSTTTTRPSRRAPASPATRPTTTREDPGEPRRLPDDLRHLPQETPTRPGPPPAFNHATYFSLAGAHARPPCAQCHINNNYTTVPTSPCSACHQADFNNARRRSTTSPPASRPPATPATSSPTRPGSQGTFNHIDLPARRRPRHDGVRQLPQPPYAPTANNYKTVPTSPCVACHQRDLQHTRRPP